MASVTFGVEKENTFQKVLKLYTNVATFNLPKEPSQTDIDTLFKKLASYDFVIASIHNTDIRVSRNFGITQKTIDVTD